MGTTMAIPKRAKLWNRGANDYKQMVMGREVFIPKDGYIECSRSEAISIRGHCTGKDAPVSLVIEYIASDKPENERWIDHRSGQQFPSKEALLKHLGIDPQAIEEAKNATVYLCPGCDQRFDSSDAAKKHMATCLSQFAPKEDKSVSRK